MPGNPEIVVRFISDTTRLVSGMNKAERGASGFSSKLGAIGKVGAFAAAGAGVAILTKALQTGIGEWEASTKVAAQTNAVLKSTGAEAGVTAKQVDALATSIMKKSGIDDEAIKSGENLLLTFTQVHNQTGKGNDIFNQATKVMADMSVALGQDTGSSAIQLGKALNDPIKGITALRRVGVSFTKAQQTQIKSLVEHGKTLDAQKLILRELNKEFGGSAEAMGKTLPGQIEILKQRFNNFAGDLVGKAVPYIQQAFSWLSTNWPAIMKSLGPVLSSLGSIFQSLGQLIAAVVGVIRANWGTIGPIVMGVATVIKSALTIIADIIKLVAALLRGDWSAAWDAAKGIVTAWVQGIRAELSILFNYYRTIFNAIRAVVSAVWNAITGLTGAALGAVRSLVVAGWNAVKGAVTSAMGAVRGAVVSGWNAIRGAVSSAVGAIRGVVSAGFNALAGVVRGAMNALVGAIRGAVGTAGAAARAIVAAVKGAFTGAIGWLKQAGIDAVMGLVHGIESVKDLPGKALHAITSHLPHVPWGSTAWEAMHSVGQTAGWGLAAGITAAAPVAEKAAKAMAKRAFDAAKGQSAASAGELSGLLQKAFSAKLGAAQTPSEQALTNLQAAHDEAGRQQALADAVAQQNAAGTDEEKKAANQAYQDAQYAITVAGLEKSAAAERVDLEGRQTVQQIAFDKSTAALTTYLESSHATAKGARIRINKLMTQYGLDMTTLGNLLGPSLAKGIGKSIDSAVAAARRMGKAVYEAVRQELKIGSPSKVMERAGRDVALGFARGISRNAGLAAQAMGGLSATTASGGFGLLEATAGPVQVNVYLGDQELRSMVRTEIVDSNTGLARSLLAGGRR